MTNGRHGLDQKQLKEFIKRRHPEYEKRLPHWEFLAATYAGGRDWFDSSIFKYHKEGDDEYKNRVARAYRFNHTREVVDLVTKYIFKANVDRNETDASDAVSEFWKTATLSGQSIDEYVALMSTKSSTLGRIWIVVDTTKTDDAVTRKDDAIQNSRVYSYIMSPQNVLDMSFDDQNELNWILVRELYRDDSDPFASSGAEIDRYRLWTRDSWTSFEARRVGNSVRVEELGTGDHNLGFVPVFPVDNISSSESPYSSPALINDVAYLDRACANYLSNLDAIIQDQTFSQLAMPAQGLVPGEDDYNKLLEVGTKRVFLFDGEGGAKPFFMSPDPKQAELIITVVKQIINEIYHSIGMAGERTKQDNSSGIDNSSGVAKAYDFERVNALLTSKAASLENAEQRLVKMVNAWAGDSNKSDEDLVSYSEDFDVRGLYDEFEISSRLSAIAAPPSVRRKQMESLVEKLFPRLASDLKKKMIDDLDDWPGEEITLPTSSVLKKGLEGRKGDGSTDNKKGAQDKEQDD